MLREALLLGYLGIETPSKKLPHMTDFAQARANMVDSQIRPNGITDSRIIAAMAEVPRELFVPASQADFAYMDEDVSLETGGEPRFLMEPMAFARLLQLAQVKAGDSVLDVGCGTGYSTVIVSRLGAHVTGFESNSALADLARQNIARLQASNAVIATGDLAQGPAGADKFDVVFVNGRVPDAPAALASRLKDGGRLVAVEGLLPMGRACLTSLAHGALSRRVAFDASVPLLPGFLAPRPAFVF